ncbi:MAG: major facilitator transporter [Anaerocolumna sp.]|jgi:MFS family permease|nr:major facilitator transporter [Anaerocolumna sp.]
MDKIDKPIWTKDFIGITIINLALFFGFQMLLPTLPVYVKSLGGVDSVIGWITGFSTIASLIIRPFSGLALDRFGRKGVFLTGIGTIILVTLAYMWFPIVGIILTIRFLHGLGWGMASTASSTIATDVIPKERFGEGMGYFGLSTSIAMALAPGIGLAVMSRFQIKGLALLSAGFVTIALILSFFIRYRQVDKGREIKKVSSPYERSSIKPSIIMFFVSASYGSITGFISLYALNQGIKSIGAFFIIFALAMLLSRPLFGKIIDRKGFSTAVYPGLIILTLAMLVLYKASTLPLFLCAALLYGVGFGAVQSSLQTMSVAHAPKDRLGAANATFFTGFDGGIGFGSILAGITASALGYSKMYLVFSLFLIIGGLLYFFIADKSNTQKIRG